MISHHAQHSSRTRTILSIVALTAASAIIVAHSTSAHAGNVGVSISVGQPGFYGRIDLGHVPRIPTPPVVYHAPVVVAPPPAYVVGAPRYVAPPVQPVYLRVPPGHRKKWHKHCYRYGACGQPVYFVDDRWYSDVYAPRYRSAYAPQGYGAPRPAPVAAPVIPLPPPPPVLPLPPVPRYR
jgi:hypothetical protein